MKKKELLTEVISSLLIVLVIGLVFTNSGFINKYKTSNRYFNLLDINMNEVIGAIDELSSSNDNLVKQVEQLTAEVNVLKSNSLGSNSALNKVYPIGSIYISTELSTPTQVHNAIGGTWEVYGDGRVLKSSTGASEQPGGSDTATLTADNLPSHSHTMAHTHTVSGTTGNPSRGHTHTVSGTTAGNNRGHTHTFSGTVASAGAHTHAASTTATRANVRIDNSWMTWADNWIQLGTNRSLFGTGGTRNGYFEIPSFTATTGNQSANHTHSFSNGTSGGESQNHTHTFSGTSGGESQNHTHTFSVTSGSNNDNTGSAGSGTAFSVLDPYITVYMYKRTA